jgi:hypothetical protein
VFNGDAEMKPCVLCGRSMRFPRLLKRRVCGKVPVFAKTLKVSQLLASEELKLVFAHGQNYSLELQGASCTIIIASVDLAKVGLIPGFNGFGRRISRNGKLPNLVDKIEYNSYPRINNRQTKSAS